MSGEDLRPMTPEELARCRVARHLLPPPGPEVAGRLIATIDVMVAAAYEAAALAMEPYVRNEDQRIRSGQARIRGLTPHDAKVVFDNALVQAYENGLADASKIVGEDGTVTNPSVLALLAQERIAAYELCAAVVGESSSRDDDEAARIARKILALISGGVK